MKRIAVIVVSFLISIQVYSQGKILIDINLNNIKNKTCNVHVNLANAKIGDEYLFARSIPGNYEINHYKKYNINPKIIDSYGKVINVEETESSFLIKSNDIKGLNYNSKQSFSINDILYPESTVYSDSLYLLNWNILAGYFEGTDNSYTIKITRPKELWGTSSMSKNSISDTVDIFTADSYSELIENPVMYSKADTSSFHIDKSKFTISVYSTLSSYNSKSIKKTVEPILRKCMSDSYYSPKDYKIICIVGNAKMSDRLIALEHPNSTVVCMPTVFKDTPTLSITLAHEFCHAIYTPLFIRSKKISNFNFAKPECDKHLWFYEGCIEYISLKKSLQAGAIDKDEFIKELNESDLYMDNIKLMNISKQVYSNKGLKYFNNFYSKGSLIALLLDIELLKKSNNKTSLSDLMMKLQKNQIENGDFDENNFLNLLSRLSGVDLLPFFKRYLNTKKNIKLKRNLSLIGYELSMKNIIGPLVYTFDAHGCDYEYNSDDQALIILRKSLINKLLGLKEVHIFKIDNKSICIETDELLWNPKKEITSFTIVENNKERVVKLKAIKKAFKQKEIVITKLDNIDKEFYQAFWNK